MIALALLRGLHLAATLSVLGTTAFIAWTLPAAADPRPALAALVRPWRVSGWIALALGVAWFAAQAAQIGGARDVGELLRVLPLVATRTRFGQVEATRAALLLIAVLLAAPSRRRAVAALVATGIAAGLQGAAGHAGASGAASLLTSEWFHLMAAGVWLGGLLPIWLSIARLSGTDAAAVCERFTPTGLACVGLLAGTGLLQAGALIGTIPALAGTPYGQVALLKVALFLLALVLAAVNRLWLTDRLASLYPGSRTHLRACVLTEAAIGLLIILAAGFLASLPPGIHEQPVWPLSWQFSLDAVRADPALRHEVIVSAALVAAAALTLVLTLAMRRYRIAAAGMLAVMLLWRAPSMALLATQAYPTSFQTSPTGISAASVLRGETLFEQHCVACHGAEGRGNGPSTAGLRIKPADLTQPHLWDHPDGDLYWWISHGTGDAEGGMAMPGFGDALSRADRWALIDYLRTHNAGVTLAAGAAPAVAVAAPDMPIRCSGRAATRMTDLRGSTVLVAASAAAAAAPTAVCEHGASPVIVALRPQQAEPPPGACAATNPDAWAAYAVLAGTPPAELADKAFLVDANGRLGMLCGTGAPVAAERIIAQDHVESRASHEHHHE